jgi:hypothetical protein
MRKGFIAGSKAALGLATMLSALGCGGGDGTTGAGGATASSGASTSAASSGTGGGSSSSSSGAGGMMPGSACAPLPAPSGNVISVTPAQAGDLPSLAFEAKDGDTLLLEDGTYHLGGAFLHFVAGATLRSKSGDATKVILDGDWQSAEVVQIGASGVTIAEVTLARATTHPIHVTPSNQSDVLGTMIYGVIVHDPGEQGIKINPDAAKAHHADGGTIACSIVRLTDDGRAHVQNSCYTGGIDAHGAVGWTVRDNRIDGFWCDDGLSEHGIHFWTGSRETLVERNVITNCARGIGFGLGDATVNRTFADAPCPGVSSAGHYLGVIRNNFVFAGDAGLFASPSGFDTGIGLEDACGAVVAHNTVVSTSPPFASLDVRFQQSNPVLGNNLFSHAVSIRDMAAPLVNQGNLEMVPGSTFMAAGAGDLHLAPGAAAAIDQGAALPGVTVTGDIDGEMRDAKPDLGADEVSSP